MLVFSSIRQYPSLSAGIITWDPQGTTDQCLTDSLSGTWEGNNWSTSETGQATPGAWPEGNAAVFAVASGTGTPAFVVTMNANHTVAGIFDGSLTPNPCQVAITGSGIITIPSGLQGFAVSSDSGDPGT